MKRWMWSVLYLFPAGLNIWWLVDPEAVGLWSVWAPISLGLAVLESTVRRIEREWERTT